ncbi:PAS domain-containing sensor histidine kinase [Rhizobium sp. L1K21]|uniref:sensor histidine kinase n=1 Tax=Rhizobium sp. L1K21 TaxID=2954933 RepID=UPI0020922AA6|nr:PAS domain-containing sensor histidine kinase [Rhizobium sp. L1K21]MCO6187980.1 ATP-binding protein [Rhizobium sp. L1K21]
MGSKNKTGQSGSEQLLSLDRRAAVSKINAGKFGILLASGTVLSAVNAHAASKLVLFGSAFNSAGVAGFSLLAGGLSAALISAVWQRRRRSAAEAESIQVRGELSEATQKISRYEALIADKNRRIVIWDSMSGQREILGHLPAETGAPADHREFLAFGKWLNPRSAGELEASIDALRSQGVSFDMIVETQRAEVLEAQGRVSGGRAFVRFVALSNLRAELAELQIERDRLSSTISMFQSLLDSVEVPVWQRSNDGTLLWVNEAFSEAVEARNPQEAIAEGKELLSTATRQKIRSSVTPESPYYDRISTVVKGERAFYEVAEIKTPGGTAGMAVDISNIEAVREELNRTLKSHAETLDHLGTPVAIFDSAQNLQFYNQAFQSLWGLDLAFLESHPSNGELLDRLRDNGKLPEQLNWKSWRENALSVYHSVDNQSDLWYLPNGQTLRVFANAHPQGGATWVFENLTEQVTLETQYNSLLKVQQETIDHLAEGVAVFGPDGKIKLCNPAFRAIWGINAEQAAEGTHIRAIEHACETYYDKPDGWRRFGQIITSFDDERNSYEGKIELTTGLVLDYAVTPLPNAQTMLTFVNITDSVLAERALTEKNAALRKADEIKNDFVQHVSYELRSPLTNIIGFTDLLKTSGIGPLNERQAEYVEHISASSSILLTIVNDILDLATVDAGIMQLEFSEVVIDDLLDEVSERVASRFQESNVTLHITASQDLGVIVADHQRLKQIFVKLLTNAANFTPEGSVIQLKCWRDGNDFFFKVVDEGQGIPKDMIDKVFNRFEARGKRSGAGLGLSIVESFVSLHHGEVSIDSVEGRGTEVTCRIPSASLSPSEIGESEAVSAAE